MTTASPRARLHFATLNRRLAAALCALAARSVPWQMDVRPNSGEPFRTEVRNREPRLRSSRLAVSHTAGGAELTRGSIDREFIEGLLGAAAVLAQLRDRYPQPTGLSSARESRSASFRTATSRPQARRAANMTP
jgi:hypothetical protein